MSVTIIAEAGVNHNGRIDLARKLIESAATAGADFVKFQTFKAERLTTRTAEKAEYQKRNGGDLESQFDMISRLELGRSDHLAIMQSCNEHGIGFLSTAFDIESVNLLIDLGQSIFKIPSGEITNLPYLRHIGRLGAQVILSTGMANLGEIEAALNVLVHSGTALDRITILHCTTQYPAPFADVNLRAIPALKASLGVQVGYSDHTEGIEAAIGAVALGATVIEKHFTLDRKLPGPDHSASLEPMELQHMVSAIRNIEDALGSGIKRMAPCEAENAKIVRKSIVAATAISSGQQFSAENLTTKRPGTGICPMRWDEVIGRLALRDYQRDELIDI